MYQSSNAQMVGVIRDEMLGWDKWFALQHRISFNAAISSCEKSGRWQEALGVFWEAQLEGVQTNARCLDVVCQ